MPNVLDVLGYKIYFWSNENFPLEPIHVHISQQPHQNATKVWILSDGSVELCNNKDKIPNKMLKKLLQTIEIYSDDIINKWEEHFNDITFKDEISREETIER